MAARKTAQLAPPLVYERLFKPESPTNKGDVWGARPFIRCVAHVGLPAFTLKKDSWRSRQEALYAYGDRFSQNLMEVEEAVFIRLLRGWAPLVDTFCEETGAKRPPAGAFLVRSTLPWGEETISVWVGARIR